MKFGKYLEANRDPEWAEYYINYNELKGHIDAIQDNLPNAEAQFGIKLEENWRTYKNFTDTWSQNLLQTKTTKQSVIPIVQMNAFMYINFDVFISIKARSIINTKWFVFFVNRIFFCTCTGK